MNRLVAYFLSKGVDKQIFNFTKIDYTLLSMVRAMCGAKPMEKKRTEDLMEMLGLKEMVPLRWYGHVLRRDDGHVLKKASEGQDEARMTREAVEDTSGKGEQGCWFGEGGCLESSKMERLLLGWGKSATLFIDRKSVV